LDYKNIKARDEIDPKYKWSIENIYREDAGWEEDFARIPDLIDRVTQYQGKLGDGAECVYSCLQYSEKLERVLEQLYMFARMRRDEDNANGNYQNMFARIEALCVKAGSATSFILPELSLLDENHVDSFIREKSDLALYRHFFKELFRQKEHILSPREEKLLAMTADLSMSTRNIFTMLNNADIKFGLVEDENGEIVEVTKGRYGSLMESPDRRVRKDAFSALYDSYGKLVNTIGATLYGSIKSDVFYARARNYPSALAAALDRDNINTRVYDSLIGSVHEKLPLLHRYMAVRRKMMKVDAIHMYDLYNPLLPELRMEVPYEKAGEMLKSGLAPLGEQYWLEIEKGLASGWVDVYENRGKTSGAYSWGAYDAQPYILMNYDNKLNDLFTLAHELGHSMHTFYSNRNQPYAYSKYSIFLAEIASTVNELLLNNYLLENSAEPQEQMYLINYYMEQFRGTVFRQTMFAEFEKIIHEKAEQGEALTPQSLNHIYLDLNRLYYGPRIVLDEEIAWEWARIPHFYSGFYVYKYATGFSAATAIKERIVKEGAPAVEQYLEFLGAGGSDYPLETLKKAGIDLTTPAPVNTALDFFEKLLQKMEEYSSYGVKN